MATTDNDCSIGSCSIRCPQYCNILFTPPPPSSSSSFSPLNIAIIGILVSVIILLSCYTFISKYCNSFSFHSHPSLQQNSGGASPSNGIDEVLINKIEVCRYRKGEGIIDGTDCSVCLGEFREEERLRLLPKCRHAFHLQCIDTWLKSNLSCPLCRAVVLRESNKASAFSAEEEQEMAVVVEDALVEIGEEDVEQSSSHRGPV